MSTAINLAPLLTDLLQLLAAVLTGVAIWGLQRLAKHWGLTIDAQQRDFLNGAIASGIKYAEQMGEKAVSGVSVQADPKIAAVANYVVSHAPDAIAHFGVTNDQLTRKILAQLPAN